MAEAEPHAASSEGQRGPGHEAARAARRAVEAVLFSIADMPPAVDRAGIRDRLLRACEFLYAAIDLPVIAVAHLQGLGEAAAIARECRGMLAGARGAAADPTVAQAAARLAEVEGALGRAYEEVARVQFDRRSELITGALAPVAVAVRPFRASRGVPQLHAFTRARLLPHILVGAEEPPAPPAPPTTTLTIPKPTTMEELVALGQAAASGVLPASLADEPEPAAPEPEEPAPFAFEPAVEELEVLRRLARDCLEDIANQRTLRVPNAIETWLDQAPFEQRLLDTLDAFAALGGAVLPLVSLFVAEADAPDPERAFAAALTLGSIDGTDTVAAAVMMFKQSAPETYPGWYDGLRLAPSPAIDAAMAELAASLRPPWVAFALDVLLARGTVPDAVVRPLLGSTDPAVTERVARALASSLPADEAVPALSNLCATAPSDSVFLAAAESLLCRGHGPALRTLREVAAGRSSGAGEGAAPPSAARVDGALELVALAGTAADLDLLLAGLGAARDAGRPRARLARALGRFGHAGAIPALLGVLREEDVGDELALAAAEALDRITGAGLREIVEEPWEVDLPPEAEGHGIPVPTRKVEKMVVDPAPWTRWMTESGDRLDRKVKLRGGAPFVPAAIVDELAAKVTPPARRAEAARELALIGGSSTTFAADDWVARQERALADLRERVIDFGVSPGLWTFAVDRWTRGARSRSVPPPPAGSAPEVHIPGPAPVPAAAAGSGGAPAPAGPPAPRAVPSFMKADPAEARPAAAADAHSQHPVPAPEAQPKKKDPLSGGTMFGVVLPILPAMPFKPGAAAAKPVAQDETIDATPDEDGHETVTGASPIPRDLALPFHRPAPAGSARAPATMGPQAAPNPGALGARAPSVAPPVVPPARPEGPAGGEHATLEPQPSPLRRPALPFQPSGPAAGPSAPGSLAPAPELTLEQYASMCAELAVFPERAEAVFAKHGLADVQRRAAVDTAWKARLARFPSERAEWERRYWQFEASFRRTRR